MSAPYDADQEAYCDAQAELHQARLDDDADAREEALALLDADDRERLTAPGRTHLGGWAAL